MINIQDPGEAFNILKQFLTLLLLVRNWNVVPTEIYLSINLLIYERGTDPWFSLPQCPSFLCLLLRLSLQPKAFDALSGVGRDNISAY